MVVRKKKYQSGEASNYVTRKQALHKLQLNLKVSRDSICSERWIICNRIWVRMLSMESKLYFIYLLYTIIRIFDGYAS